MKIWTTTFILVGIFSLMVGGHGLFVVYHNFLIFEKLPVLHMLALSFCIVLMVFARMRMEFELNRTE